MKANILRIILTIFCVAFLLQHENNFAATPETSEGMKPGTASGKLSVNVQTFKMKYAYARKQPEDNEAVYLVMVTNRPFPLDFSKFTRFELDKYAVRYDFQGVALGIDKDQHLVFIDILRLERMIGNAQFHMEPITEDSIEGTVYTNKEIRFLRNKVKFNITFNAKLPS